MSGQPPAPGLEPWLRAILVCPVTHAPLVAVRDIILQGEAGMRMHLQTKLGGTEPAFRPLILEDPLVCIGDCLPEHGLLILEAIAGRKHWFLSPEEVRGAWRLTDPIQSHFDNPATPLYFYPSGSEGPKEADDWLKREGWKWL